MIATIEQLDNYQVDFILKSHSYSKEEIETISDNKIIKLLEIDKSKIQGITGVFLRKIKRDVIKLKQQEEDEIKRIFIKDLIETPIFMGLYPSIKIETERFDKELRIVIRLNPKDNINV